MLGNLSVLLKMKYITIWKKRLKRRNPVIVITRDLSNKKACFL
jgi:hypothetical protein